MKKKEHYTPLFPITSSGIAFFQDEFGANMWYNAMLPIKIQRYTQRQMKYGVISKYNLIQVLLKKNAYMFFPPLVY